MEATTGAAGAAGAASSAAVDVGESTPADSAPQLRLDWQEAPIHGENFFPSLSPKFRVSSVFHIHGFVCHHE
jgi:hypothetical protein